MLVKAIIASHTKAEMITLFFEAEVTSGTSGRWTERPTRRHKFKT